MTKARAKKTILSHLERHTNTTGNFMVTHRKCQYWYKVLQKAMFTDMKVPAEFVVRRLRSDWGHYLNNIITITTRIKTRQMFMNTLAHEMVHHYERTVLKEIPCHSDVYIEYARRFKEELNIDL